MDTLTMNNQAFKEDLTKTERRSYYSMIGENGIYDKNMSGNAYRGPEIGANIVAKYMAPKSARILDVAAGTGLLAERLKMMGYTNIDALEPSEGMIEKARKKNLYIQYIVDYMSERICVIEDDTYDCLVIVGGMGEGHIPTKALHEMIRIVKPGGYVIIVMRNEYLWMVEDYRGRLEPLMKRLETQGVWRMVERSTIPNYFVTKEGVVFVLKLADIQ